MKMKFLNRKLRRDIARNWTQFFSVFLMAMLSVLIFVGLQGAWHGLEVSLERYTKSYHLPNSWVYSINFTDDEIEKIEKISGVEEVRKKIRIPFQMKDVGEEQECLIDTFLDTPSTVYVTNGRKLEEGVKGVWLNKEYATQNHIGIGEQVTLEYGGKAMKLEVVGFVQAVDKIYFTGSLEFIAPNYKQYGYGFISEEMLEQNGFFVPYNVMEIYGKQGDIRSKLEKILGQKMLGYYDRNTLLEVSEPLDRVGQIRNLSYLFSFIFLLLALLSMDTTIRRLIESQTKEIAILKALGFSNREIGLHYGSFGICVGGIGALIGAICSPAMSWFVLETQKTMFSIPKWTIAYSYHSFLLIVFVILLCTGSALYATKDVLFELPAFYLRGEKGKKVKPILLEKISFLWKKYPMEIRWAIRDAMIHKIRIMMGIVGVAGGMMLLIAGFGMPSSIRHLVEKAYENDFNYHSRIEVLGNTKVKKQPQEQWVQISQARFQPDDGYNRLLIILSDGDYVHMMTEEGTPVEEGGIYITKGFAKRAKIEKGDKITVIPALDGKEYSFFVKGIVTSETNQGAYIMQKTWEQSGGNFSPQTLLVGEKWEKDSIGNENIGRIIPIKAQKENAYEFVDSLMSVFYMIIAFAILLVVVVLYNLGALNFVERVRDYATLQVIGFYRKELQKITVVETMVTTFIGWLLGIPLGIWFLNQYVQTFSTIRLEYTAYVSTETFCMASLVVWICSFITAVMIGKRIEKIHMVEALKGIDS